MIEAYTSVKDEAERWVCTFGRAGETILTYLLTNQIDSDDVRYINSLEKFFEDAIKGKTWLSQPTSLLPEEGVRTSSTYLLAKKAIKAINLENDVMTELQRFKEILPKIKKGVSLKKDEKKYSRELIKLIHAVLEGA